MPIKISSENVILNRTFILSNLKIHLRASDETTIIHKGSKIFGTMAFKITFLLVIGLSALINNNTINGQELDARFIVYIAHFPHPFLNETVKKCVGTLVSVLHILTTASCVTVQLPTRIAVHAETMTLVPDGGNYTSRFCASVTTQTKVKKKILVSTTVPADRVFIHPFYVETNQYSNNAALVTVTI